VNTCAKECGSACVARRAKDGRDTHKPNTSFQLAPLWRGLQQHAARAFVAPTLPAKPRRILFGCWGEGGRTPQPTTLFAFGQASRPRARQPWQPTKILLSTSTPAIPNRSRSPIPNRGSSCGLRMLLWELILAMPTLIEGSSAACAHQNPLLARQDPSSDIKNHRWSQAPPPARVLELWLLPCSCVPTWHDMIG
jgi:hypothetical protein